VTSSVRVGGPHWGGGNGDNYAPAKNWDGVRGTLKSEEKAGASRLKSRGRSMARKDVQEMSVRGVTHKHLQRTSKDRQSASCNASKDSGMKRRSNWPEDRGEEQHVKYRKPSRG